MSPEENPPAGNPPAEPQQNQEPKTFTQAEVDAMIRDRLRQQAKNQFGDYDQLKAKAEGAQTLEDRFASLEKELAASRADALRSRIAAQFGISTVKGAPDEMSDADLFLTGADEATMTAQAQRLAAQRPAPKKSNVAPREGATTNGKDPDSELRAFAGELFGGGSD